MNNWNWNLINGISTKQGVRCQRRNDLVVRVASAFTLSDTNEVSNVESVKLIKVTENSKEEKEEIMFDKD